MRITDFLDIRAVEANLGASQKPGVIRELVGLFLRVEPELDPNLMVDILTRREKLQSTGIGNGIAIPHGRTDAVNRIIAVAGRSTEGVDFESLDGEATHLFFALLVPESEQGSHLKCLARLSRLLKQPSTRHALLNAPDAHAMYQIISTQDAELEVG
jgi:PTS system nitrogen regulatory IIA component